jgi:uncharacterized phage protein gp47/JayE
MFEDMTYEEILRRMIDRVESKYPNLDTREGSIMFDALAGAALELAIKYTEMDNVLAESFVKTASREYKLIGCESFGMDTSIFEAHAGTFKGEFDVEVEIGSQWNCELYNYTILEFLGMNGDYYTYSMMCDTPGSAPNSLVGSLIAITDIPADLNYAELTECLIEGEDEVSDEDINTAYEEFINSSDEDGNVNQYVKWCNEYEGIGNSKIIPLWDGANTVKVSILSASNRRATDLLVSEFQEYLDPGCTGMGDGVAPIGAFVTVSTATEVPITVSAEITMMEGYHDTTPINNALTEHFKAIAYKKSTVSYMSVGATILAVEGVDSINNLKINGGTSDISLKDEEIGVLGTWNWVVI